MKEIQLTQKNQMAGMKVRIVLVKLDCRVDRQTCHVQGLLTAVPFFVSLPSKAGIQLIPFLSSVKREGLLLKPQVLVAMEETKLKFFYL